ncbi:MAG: type II toxin-antitoxin system RelE/ParE family toxin [Pseudomonadota bacterium]
MEDKALEFVGSSQDDLRAMPKEVRIIVGTSLFDAERGEKSSNAKPLKRFKGGGVLEVVANHDGDTYRAVYTVKFKGVVYVLHCFQKKSKKGIATPKPDMDLIKQRLKTAEEHYQAHYAPKQKKGG